MRTATIVAMVLALSCSKQGDSKAPPAKDQPAASSDRQPAATPVPIGIAAGKGLADTASDELRRVTATPVPRAISAPKGLFDALVTKGKRWELRNGKGERLIIETDQVHTVGKARVARLRWSHDGPDGLDRDYYGGWPRQVAVTDQGLLVMDSVVDDRELAKRVAGKPQYADPPRLDQPNQRYYAHAIDDMVCLGFDFWVGASGDDICGDESCLWRFCLRPGEIAGADGLGSSDDYGPVEYTSAPGSSQRSRQGELFFTASSQHQPWKSYSFEAFMAGDRRLATSWQPAKGKAVGEWIEVRVDQEASTPMVLDAIELANGYQFTDKFGDLFELNARVRTATIALDGKPEVIVDFAENQRGYVRVDLGGKTATTVRLTIDEIWAGKKWQDVAISELGLLRRVSPE